MSFKKLKVTNKELIHLLKRRKIDLFSKLTRKKLLETFKSYDKTDLQRLAKLRDLKINKNLSVNEIEQILITNVNLDQLHNELNNLYVIETDNIKKAIDNLDKQIDTKKQNKFSNQLLRSYRDRIDNITKEINYLEKGRQLKSEQDKITKILKLLKQKKLPIKSQEGSISHDDLSTMKRLLKLPKNELHKIAQLRDIDITNVKKQDLIYMLLKSQSNVKESQYLSFLNQNTTNKIDHKINEIRKLLIEIGKRFTNKEKTKYTKELYDIVKMLNSSHENRGRYYSKLSNELKSLFNSIVNNIFKLQHG